MINTKNLAGSCQVRFMHVDRYLPNFDVYGVMNVCYDLFYVTLSTLNVDLELESTDNSQWICGAWCPKINKDSLNWDSEPAPRVCLTQIGTLFFNSIPYFLFVFFFKRGYSILHFHLFISFLFNFILVNTPFSRHWYAQVCGGDHANKCHSEIEVKMHREFQIFSWSFLLLKK